MPANPHVPLAVFLKRIAQLASLPTFSTIILALVRVLRLCTPTLLLACPAYLRASTAHHLLFASVASLPIFTMALVTMILPVLLALSPILPPSHVMLVRSTAPLARSFPLTALLVTRLISIIMALVTTHAPLVCSKMVLFAKIASLLVTNAAVSRLVSAALTTISLILHVSMLRSARLVHLPTKQR